jgi:hypothetical protein
MSEAMEALYNALGAAQYLNEKNPGSTGYIIERIETAIRLLKELRDETEV